MKRYLIFACTCLISHLYVAGQELVNSYDADELKAGFYAQYVDKKENASLTKMEPLFSASDTIFLHTFGDEYFLCPSVPLHQAGKLNLPPSKFVIYNTSENQRILCWMDVLQDAGSKENTSLRKTLQKKYGSIPMQGDTVLVPAKWFTGQLRRMSNPFLYGNEVVARGLQADSVAEGTIVEWEEDDNRRHNYWAGSYLERDARMITKRRTDSRVFVTMDGQRDTSALHLENERGMALYERDINRCIDARLLPRELNYDKEYSIMLYLDEGGKAHLNALLPRELTIEDRLLLTILATAVEYQPKHSFAGYVSARGRFPAVYLKAHFRGGKWYFHDYRYE